MKKTILRVLTVLILIASVNVVCAKTKATSSATAQAIKYYKAGNYTQAYMACDQIIKKDPSDALAQYYLAMSYVQLGRKDEAIAAYDIVISMSQNGILGSYAKKGKKCIETPALCHEPVAKPGTEDDTAEDRFIKGVYGSGFSHRARGIHEKEKIENIKREINRYDELAPEKFKDYRDFSSQAPSNDEIVSAIRTLQRAGIAAPYAVNSSSDSYDMFNMLFSNNSGASSLSPQVIQSLLSTQMSAGL